MSKLHLFPSVTLFGIVSAMLLVSACQDGSSTSDRAQAGGDRPVVGVSVLTLTHPFFQDVTAAMREEAEAQGYDIVINSCDFDAAKQKNQVSDYVVKQVDAIVLAPCDSKAVGTAIGEANKAGIPVFTADIAALASGIQVVSHVATNNYEGGKLAARAVLEAIGNSGEVAIIDHPEVESVIQRTKGFTEVIDSARAAGADIEIVADLAGGGVKDKAFPVAQDILQRFPNLDAIFAINDDTALAAVAATEKAGKVGKVQIIGFDGTPEARRNIRDGRIYADVIQHPKDIGRETIQAIAHYMAGEQVTPETLIPATLYRQADAQQDPALREASATTE